MNSWYLAMIIMLVLLIGVVVFIIIERRKYKHKVEVRELSQGRKLIRHDLARDYTDASGANLWKLRKEKDPVKRYLSVPPDAAIELDYKGRKCVTIYRDESGSYQYQIDNTEDLGDEKTIKPLKTSHRIAMMDNFKKAEKRGATNFLREHGLQLGFGLLIVILFVSILVFWGDIAKPVIEITEHKQAMTEAQTEMIRELKGLKRNIQEIRGVEYDEVNETPPN